jgi:hypothetical protein
VSWWDDEDFEPEPWWMAACQVCGSSGSNRRLSVDHDHTSGKVRGLLCASCNFAIGNMGDDPDKLRAAANYLEETRV